MKKQILDILFSEHYSKFSVMLIDFSIIIISFLIIDLIIFEPNHDYIYLNIFFSGLLFIIIGNLFKIYNSVLRYFNYSDFKKVLYSSLFTILIIHFYNFLIINFIIEKFLIQLFIIISVTIAYRLFVKSYYVVINKNEGVNTFIIGAGESGVILKRSLYSDYRYNVVGFIDDDKYKIGRSIDGVLVYDFEKNIQKLIFDKEIKKIIFSTNKFTSKRRKHFFKIFKELNIQVFDLSNSTRWINNKPSSANLKKIKIEDFLSRPEITINWKKNLDFYKNKTVLITGAAGSIGSEIVRQLLVFDPKKIIIIDNNETAVFNLINEVSEFKNIEFHLLSTTDIVNCERIFQLNKIDYLFHAAAYKHVPILEKNAKNGVYNNIIGTINFMNLSIKYSISKFLLVSTDKAVNPSSVMGASKRICELLCSIKSNPNSTEFITTRFGNVLGSNGSVIPIFSKQIENGGPITLTHKDVTRYFMTIPEASKLVVEACRLGVTNQVFLFDMGDPIKIMDLAKQMISSYGYVYGKDIEIKITGLRPGEKLYEELLIKKEKLLPSSNKYIFICEKEIVSDDVKKLINNLSKDLKDPLIRNSQIVESMKNILPEFISKNSMYSTFDNEESIV